MNKAADTTLPLLEPIQTRWSPRAFSDRRVESEKLLTVLEAARWAPSSFNEQPWRFVLATKDEPETYARLLHCLKEKNQSWAKSAPVLMLSLAKRSYSNSGGENRHALHDVGLAVGTMIVQASALGLYTHQMGGIYPERAREVYGIPEDFKPIAGIALGYLGDVKSLPEDLRDKERAPRGRRALGEVVFGERFGEGVSLLEAV